jgi:hypothetical protein
MAVDEVKGEGRDLLKPANGNVLETCLVSCRNKLIVHLMISDQHTQTQTDKGTQTNKHTTNLARAKHKAFHSRVGHL